MKKLLIFLISIISVNLCAQTNSLDLAGYWEGVQNSDSLLFVFEQDSVVTMINKSKNQSIGGRNIIRNGKSVRLVYTIDLSQKPSFIDLIIQETDTKNEQGRIRGIFEVLTEDHIRLDIGQKGDRPTEFGELAIILTRRD